MPARELVPMHSYTPSSSGNTVPLMTRTEVVIPFVILVTVPACRSKSTSGAVNVSVCLLVGMSSPFSLQVKVGVGVPCEVQVRVRLPPSMTVSVGDWVVVIGATESDRGTASATTEQGSTVYYSTTSDMLPIDVVYVNNSAQMHVQVKPFVVLLVPGSYGRYRVYRVKLLITACMTYRWLHFI